MSRFQQMVDMAKSTDDVKEEIASSYPSTAPGKASVPVYPYGLCMSWDEEILKKLKMENERPRVGDVIHFCVTAKVTSVSESESETADGTKKPHCRVELQGTEIGVEHENEESVREEATEQRRGRFYGNVDGDGGKEAA